MFDVGFWELTVIFVVALLVLGPERLPAVARTAGRWLDRARRTMAVFRTDVEKELSEADLRDDLKKAGEAADNLKDLKDELEESVVGSSSEQKPRT